MLKSLTIIEGFLYWVAELIITDEYLTRREKEWQEADEREFYLS